MNAPTENHLPVAPVRGTHPALTMAFFGAIITVLLIAGSHVSKLRSVERAASAELAASLAPGFDARR